MQTLNEDILRWIILKLQESKERGLSSVNLLDLYEFFLAFQSLFQENIDENISTTKQFDQVRHKVKSLFSYHLLSLHKQGIIVMKRHPPVFLLNNDLRSVEQQFDTKESLI